MKEIELKGLDEKVFVHTNKSGLNTYMWVNPKVNGCYISLSVRYGSIDTSFKIKNKVYNVPNGLAHFLEHVKFNEKSGVTAHDFFLTSGADANAFTTFNYTSYICYTTKNVLNNLSHVIDFVYTPYFTKKLINKEKGIIVEESNMTKDDAYSYAYYLLLQNLFKNVKYRNFITGNKDDIKSITIDDVKIAYDTFYHPENMFLCITGNFNPYEVAKKIDDCMSKKRFSEYKNPTVLKTNEPGSVYKKYDSINLNIKNTRVKYGIKIPRNVFKKVDDLNLREILSLVLNINFGSTSDFKDDLIRKGIITSISHYADIYDDYVILIINADSEYPKEYIELLEKRLSNLDTNRKDFERKKKVDVATLILDFDDIESVNMRIQDNLINYNELVSDMKEKLEAITYDEFSEVVGKIDIKNHSILVINPLEDEKKN